MLCYQGCSSDAIKECKREHGTLTGQSSDLKQNFKRIPHRSIKINVPSNDQYAYPQNKYNTVAVQKNITPAEIKKYDLIKRDSSIS